MCYARQGTEFVPVTREVRLMHAIRRRRPRPLPPLYAKGDLRAAACYRRYTRGYCRYYAEALRSRCRRSLFGVKRLLFLACGTSYYAALTAKYWIEAIAGLHCDVEIASEYRYRVSIPNPQALVVTISQSGETADTLAHFVTRATI